MRLNHVTLPTSDLARAIAFYERLGLTLIVRADPRYARFAVDDDSTLSVDVTADGLVGSAEVHLCCADVDADVAAAIARGLTFETPPTDQSYLWRTAAIRDPDGNRIILFSPGNNQHFPPWRLDGRRE